MISTDKYGKRRDASFVRGVVCLVLLLACVEGPAFSASSDQEAVLEDFNSYKAGQTPEKGWKTRNGDASQVYRVQVEGDERYLAADDTGQSIQFFKKGGWELPKTPVLKWCWRVRKFPKDSDERLSEKNDSAASVYVVFPRRWFIPETIKYVWSESVPVGTKSKKRGRFATLIIRSGKKELGQWVEESRNVLEDYEKLFGRRPPNPVAFGFLTDANAVKGTASADYDFIRVLSDKITVPSGP